MTSKHRLAEASNPKGSGFAARRYPGRVDSSVVFAVIRFACELGLPEDVIARLVGSPRADAEGRFVAWPADVPPRLCAELVRAHPDRALPIELARSAMGRFHSPLIDAVRSAPTVDEALEVMARYHELVVEDGALTVDRGARETSVSWQHPADALDGSVMQAALGAFHWWELRSHAAGPLSVSQVRLAAEPLGPKSAYEEHFGVLPQFNFSGGYTAFTLRNADRELPLSTSNQSLFRFSCWVLETRLETRHHGPAEEITKLHHALRESVVNRDFSITNLAREMRTSVRSAQRVAARHGVRLRGMVEEVRLGEAKRLLGDPTLTVAAVSESIGYSDERAFRRAFRRWTQQSPSDYRRALRDSSSAPSEPSP